MIRKASVTRTQAGQTIVSVRLRDGDLSSSYSVKVWDGVPKAVRAADAAALKALDEIKGA